MRLTQKQINIISENAADVANPEQDDDCPTWLRYYHKVQKKLNLQNVNNLLDLNNIENQMKIKLSDYTKKQIKGWIKSKSNCC